MRWDKEGSVNLLEKNILCLYLKRRLRRLSILMLLISVEPLNRGALLQSKRGQAHEMILQLAVLFAQPAISRIGLASEPTFQRLCLERLLSAEPYQQRYPLSRLEF